MGLKKKACCHMITISDHPPVFPLAWLVKVAMKVTNDNHTIARCCDSKNLILS